MERQKKRGENGNHDSEGGTDKHENTRNMWNVVLVDKRHMGGWLRTKCDEGNQ